MPKLLKAAFTGVYDHKTQESVSIRVDKVKDFTDARNGYFALKLHGSRRRFLLDKQDKEHVEKAWQKLKDES